MRIEACFDSHVHWPFTGEWADRLKLGSLKSATDVTQLKIEPMHSRGEWLLGFGWDATKWPDPPHRKILDQIFPSTPVAFSRCDGHALWVNTEALKRAGLLENVPSMQGGRFERDLSGQLTGVLIDKAADLVHDKIPKASGAEMRRQLLKAVKVFNDAGYTHIRDMTCSEPQWHEALKLDQSGLLTLAVEEYFWLNSPSEWDQVFALFKKARLEQSLNLRAKGLKVFMDGALGSEGAYLSKCYHQRDHQGLLLWDKAALENVLRPCWEENIDVAIHVIGDEAADQVVALAASLKDKGVTGPLHLEHCELLRPETIEKMKGLSVFCHLQPSHWLSDRAWLKEKIGSLSEWAFPWRRLQEADIPFDFGSDAPIEPPVVPRIFEALEISAENGIPRLLGSPTRYMSHGDLSWAPNTFSLFESMQPTQVVFRGEHLF